ncbi:hypothetical protein VTN00DRAFT_8788 [Thermoascus crustaceus]|uniref:uncharacterized protein n=1 Tax=Thermoascus crustaceus TaxID=5088 RepID=UPI003742060C
MDLVAGVRKEGSRGGRDAFKWEDVKESQHRENYLGHSIMAPVGRWQKGKDLQWYAKSDEKEADKAQTAREEEIRRVKEAEQEAMARALGLPVAPKTSNANLTPLGGKEVQKVVQETTADDDAAGEAGRGVGFGAYGAARGGGIEVATATETGNGDTEGTTMIASAIAMSADTDPGLDRDLATELTGEEGLHPAREAGTGGVMMTTTGLVVENEATRRTNATNIVTAGEKEMSIMSVGGDLTVARTSPWSVTHA